MIQKVENHEALADVTIRDMQRAAARARAHLERVSRETVRLEQKMVQAKREVERWETRAVAVAADDRAKAKACIQRKRVAEREHSQLEMRLEEQRNAQHSLDNDINHITRKIEDFKRKRSVLQTRQSRAEAAVAVQAADSDYDTIDDVFDRWEFSIVETESMQGMMASDQDPLDDDFRREEEESAIEDELNALLSEQKAQV